ncbi:unnamed protein product, partial [marine sediment metagenome]
LKYPSDWDVDESQFSVSGVNGYTIDYSDAKKDSDGSINEYVLSTWLDVEEGGPYALNKSARGKASDILEDIYSDQKLTASTRSELSDFAGEFLGYSARNRTDLKYLESSDGKSRGVSFVNTTGQDVGIVPIYHATLYNPDKNVVVEIWYHIPTTSKEIKALNDRLEGVVPEQLTNIDTQIKTEFKTSVESSDRSDLSFGSLMDTVDKSIKSLSF